jgi:glycogen(starch) synthase
MPAPVKRPPRGRVLLTTDAVGGVWTHTLDLARRLAQADVETMLVVLGPSPSASQAADAWATPRLSLIDTGLPLDWMATESADVLEVAAALRGLARGGRADLVHLHSPTFAAGGRFGAPVIGACHSCVATWWSAVKDGPMPDDFGWRSQLLWQGMQATDALVAPTRAFAQEISRTYEIPTPHVVWNGRKAPADLRADRAPMVMTSGRLWDEGKNVGVLDAAAALIKAPLNAAGFLEGPNGSSLRLRHARALGQLSADEVAAWLRRAAIYASSALYEPFGLGILEAAQAGCALVLSDIATLRELWDGAAVFVDPRDPEAYAQAFNRLLRDPSEQRALGLQAKARSARYGLDRMGAGYLELYGRLQPRLKVPASQEAAA